MGEGRLVGMHVNFLCQCRCMHVAGVCACVDWWVHR